MNRRGRVFTCVFLMIRTCTLNLRIWPSDLDFAGWLPFRKIVVGYDFWIRRVTYCCYLHIVVAGELCCLSDILLFNFYSYIVMIVLYICRYWTCLWSSCGTIIGCQLDWIPDSFPLTSRPLIKVYIVYYSACKLARAKNKMCFSVNYTHNNNNNNK